MSVSGRGSIWRRELVAAIASGDDAVIDSVRQRLGMEKETPASVDEPPLTGIRLDTTGVHITRGGENALRDVALSSDELKYPDDIEPVTFWAATSYLLRQPFQAPPAPKETRIQWTHPPAQPPTEIPIAPKEVLHPRLRTAISSLTPGRGLDMPRIIASLARARMLDRLPRKRLRRWGDQILLVFDRSDHLVPFFADQERLAGELELITPAGTIQPVVTRDPRDGFTWVDPNGDIANWSFNVPCRIVVMSDMGLCRNQGKQSVGKRWTQWAQSLTDQGCAVVGLVPFATDAASRALRQAMRLVCWQQNDRQFNCDTDQRRAEVDQLLSAISPVVRLEPGLLRSIRHVIGIADATIESQVWQHPVVTSKHISAATLDKKQIDTQFRPGFLALSTKERLQIVTAIRSWRFRFSRSPMVWFQELMDLDYETQELVRQRFPNDVDDAVSAINHLARTAQDAGTSRYLNSVRQYGGRATHWWSGTAWEDHRIQKALHDLWDAAPIQHTDGPSVDPQLVAGSNEVQTVHIGQRGSSFVFGNSENASPRIATIHSRNAVISVSTESPRNQLWKSGRPPEWAYDWGQDEYGKWARIRFDSTVFQTVRWIPPGEFLMGSPESEEGRVSDEGPQHLVTLTKGFWLFDTQITQNLFKTVLPDHQSHFSGPSRPVDSVSWNRTQEFIQKITKQFSVDLCLPTEAQWEYACRAGTTTRYAFGDQITQQQAAFARSSETGTADVKSFDPNGYGLYDMHGNVWEWCQDYGIGDYSDGHMIDPSGPESGVKRVLRGGSWFNLAQSVRSAYRLASTPGLRSRDIGFRCALVQASSAEPQEGAWPPGGAQAVATNQGGAAVIRLSDNHACSISIPNASKVRIRTDTDQLQLARISKPHWAKAIGRDQYGIWADLVINTQGGEQNAPTAIPPAYEKLIADSVSNRKEKGKGDWDREHKIRQRLRWIPPGQFQMGSPDSDDIALAREKPRHQVALSRGFWLFDTPVTQSLWTWIVQENPSQYVGAERPVDSVSWDDAQGFIQRMNERVEFENSDGTLALPTESQWEYACRAGTTTRYSFGDSIREKQATFDRSYEAGTSNVKVHAPNNWGLFDMHGQVLEWCEDWYGDYDADRQVNPVGPEVGDERVLRGGGWFNDAQVVRSAYRLAFSPDDRDDVFGFRCAFVQASSERGAEVASARDEQPHS